MLVKGPITGHVPIGERASARRRAKGSCRGGSQGPVRAVARPKCSEDGLEEAGSNKGWLQQLWESTLRPLRDFGFGRRSVWEGGAGLFVIAGVGLGVALVGWAKGLALKGRKSYQAIVQLPEACGVRVGTPIRVRGVPVGSVQSVKPSMDRVDVLVEVADQATVIPRDSHVEANQSGLIAEPLIDVTPKTFPDYEHSPLEAGCEEEGSIVCDRGRIQGHRGVAMDDLVRVCTKLANQVDKSGMDEMMGTATSVNSLIRDVKPLVDQAEIIANELRPIIHKFREGELASSVDNLAAASAAVAEDTRRLQSAVLTEENAELLRQSVSTLAKTLQHVERISGDLSNVTGDPSTRQNLRALIQSLSRLVDA